MVTLDQMHYVPDEVREILWFTLTKLKVKGSNN